MSIVRLLNDGTWNKPPVLTAARQILMEGLAAQWPLARLGDLATFVNGTSYDPSEVTEGGTPIIRISNISNPGSPHVRTRQVFDDKFMIQPGDLLVSWSASFKSIIWRGPAGVLNQHIFKVIEQPGHDRGYIRHAIEAAFADMQRKVVGIGMMHLRRGDFLGHQVAAPPLELQQAVRQFLDWIELPVDGPEPVLPPELSVQRRIVARIEELAAKIEEARGLRQQAIGEADALLTARLGQLVGNPYRGVAGELELNSYMRIGDVAVDVADGPHVTPTYVDRGVPFLTVLNIVSGRIDFSGAKFVTWEDHAQFQRRAKAEPGDVLVSKDGTLGVPCFVDTDREFSFFVSVALIKPQRRALDGRFLTWMIRAPYMQERIRSRSRGDMIRHLVLREIRDLLIPLPSLEEQHRIVCYLDRVQRQLSGLRRRQAETAIQLNAMLPSTLDRAFSGQL